MREVNLGLTVSGSGLCGKPWAERREERDLTTVSGDRKRPTLDRLYCRYSYPLGPQTDSECDETWQTVYLQHNKTARQLSSHSENISWPLIKYYFGRAGGACKCVWAQNGQQRERGDRDGCKFSKTCRCNADDGMERCNMQANDKATTTNNWRTPGTSVSGRHNTPRLREDLVPRSRMALEGKRKRKRRGKTKLLL